MTPSELAWQQNRNTPPVAQNQLIGLYKNSSVNVAMIGWDAESAVTYSIVSTATNGTLSGLNTATGTIDYLPSTNFVGNDAFTFQVSDGMLTTIGLVTVAVFTNTSCIYVPSNSTAVTLFVSPNLLFGCMTGTNINTCGQAGISTVVLRDTNALAGNVCFQFDDGTCTGYSSLISTAASSLSPTNFGVPILVSGGEFRQIYNGSTNVVSSSGPNSDSYSYCNLASGKFLLLKGLVSYTHDPLSSGFQELLVKVTGPITTNIVHFTTSNHTNEPFTVSVPLANFATNTITFSWYLKNDPEVVFPLVRGNMNFNLAITNTITP